MNILNAIGIFTAIKSFVIFLVYGFITTTYIHFVYGFKAELPKSVEDIISGPLSILTFGWLTLIGLLTLFWSTIICKNKCDFDKNTPRWVFYFSLPICEVAINLGVVIGATLLGVAVATTALYFFGWTDVNLYSIFYGLASFMFLTTYPVVYFAVSFVNSEKMLENKLDISALIYIFISAIVIFNSPSDIASETPLTKNLFDIALLMSALIIAFYIMKKWRIKP